MSPKIAVLIFVFFVVGCSNPPPPKNTTSKTMPTFVKHNRESVVAINIMLGDSGDEVVVGTGFLIADNLIATCRHILEEKATQIWIHWDRSLHLRPILAEVAIVDEHYDLALLKLKQKVSLAPIQLAQPKNIEVGDPITILGFPDVTHPDLNFKYLHAFRGMIASIQPASDDEDPRIILDGKVFQGDSGGPVVSLQTQKVVGVISHVIVDRDEEKVELSSAKPAKSSFVEYETIGIAVPIEYLHNLWEKYIEEQT